MNRLESLRARLNSRSGQMVSGSGSAEPTQSTPVETNAQETIETPVETASEERLSASEISEMFGDVLPEAENAHTEDYDNEDFEDEDEDEEDIDDILSEPTNHSANTETEPPLGAEEVADSDMANPPEPTFYNTPEIHNRNTEAFESTRFSTFTTSRFSGAPWFDAVKNSRITLIGCGGIGSWTALMLARLNPRQIVVYDDDIVELHNMAGQFFSAEHIGYSKASAVSENLKRFAAYYNTLTLLEKFLDSSSITNIVITCLDNMHSRKTAFEVWKRRVFHVANPSECLFVDGRLSAEVFQVFAVRGDDKEGMQRYERTLFSDSEVAEGICSYRQTSFMANMIGSVIANVFVNFLASKTNPIREIPFKIEYMAEAMYFKTEM